MAEGLVELVRQGTRKAIHLWPFINEIIISWPGQVHAWLTLEGQKKVAFWGTDQSPDVETEEEDN
jgi:hypothetical protein